MRVEAREVIFQYGSRVALGIDTDEERAGAIRVGPERAHHFRNVEQGGRAHVGTVRVAEEDEERLALEIGSRNGLAVLIGERERAADRRRGGARPELTG